MQKVFSILVLTGAVLTGSIVQAQSFEKGDTLVLVSNLHYEPGRNELYTLNYQLPGMFEMCKEATVIKKKKKRIVVSIDSVEYTMDYDKHSKKAGVSFEELLGNFFGTECDSDKAAALSEIDRKGIRNGLPYVGMSKQGILYAMGRPPKHATPDLDGNMWMYWVNRFKRKAIHFDDNGLVERIRN